MNINIKEKNIKSYIEEITGIKLPHEESKESQTPSEASPSLTLTDKDNQEIAQIHNISDLEHLLLSINQTQLTHTSQHNTLSTWLNKINENKLATQFLYIEQTTSDGEQIRKKMIDTLEEYHYAINQENITAYQRTYHQDHIQLSHIGTDAFGGKARGLAFIADLLSNYITEDMFPGLRITIPRSIVLATGVFDKFIKHNNINITELASLTDERIAAKFMHAALPATIIGDLRAFVQNTRKPLIFRSSSLLEDSLFQPFAGIYSSMFLPNESWETEQRFQEICNAIKYIYASTFFEKARTYIKSTPKTIQDEKMAVLLQEVVGNKHEHYFYPTISGVAKSYNYYPSGPCKAENGIVYLALGLGKAIVDGGSSYCFCPERPKAPLFGTPKDFIRYSQKHFYALKLQSIYTTTSQTEDTTLETLDIDTAKKHGVLDKIASTYLPQDDQLYPGLYDNGAIVIDFGPIINYDELPLAKALKLLLKIGEHALGYPVEIEFAVNISTTKDHPSELIILQIRSMLPPNKYTTINLDNIDLSQVLCHTNNALGNGIIDNIKDIIYIKSEDFNLINSPQVVPDLRERNTHLMDTHTPYILIGPGRWGSADHFLGIPVIWSDIAGVKAIIETPYKDRPIDPSQGSHFFHDMISSQIAYLITKKDRGNIQYSWLNTLPIIKETNYIKHVQSPQNLQIIIDGQTGKAIIQHQPQKEKNHG